MRSKKPTQDGKQAPVLLSSRAMNRRKLETGACCSLRRRLTLYWVCMALAVLSAALLLFSITGVTSRTARQFHTTLENQRSNTAAQLTAQMDTLTAKGIALSKQISTELDGFLARRGLAFEALNDNPVLMEELESALLPILKTTLEGTPCSGAYFSLDATANTALPKAEHSRMGLYLRYSGLYSANPSQNMMYFRGTVAAAREAGLSLHNRWNMELNTSLIDGWEQVMSWTGERLSDGCLWTERLSLTDTWEDVTLLCVPIRDETGTVRGVCGIELSALYFSMSHGAVSSPYGSLFTLLAPMNGDRLLLDRAMTGDTAGARLPSDGELRVKGGKYYDTFTCGGDTYLGKYEIVPGKLADGNLLAAVVLVPESSFRACEQTARRGWTLGTILFLAAMLAAALLLSRSFVRPFEESIAAVKSGNAAALQPSGIRELDDLLALVNRYSDAELSENDLPPELQKVVESFATQVETLTATERMIFDHYARGSTPRDIPDLMFISASTVKAHNRSIYRKLGVSSYDELKAYIDIFRRCGEHGAAFCPFQQN